MIPPETLDEDWNNKRVENAYPKFTFCNQNDRTQILKSIAKDMGLPDDCVESAIEFSVDDYNCSIPLDRRKSKESVKLYIYRNHDLVDLMSTDESITDSFRKYLVVGDNDGTIYLLYNSIVDMIENIKNYWNDIYKCSVKYDLRIKMNSLLDCTRMIDQNILDKLFEYYLDCLNV